MTTSNTGINIMLIDDHSLVRDGIKSLLEDELDLRVISEASSGEEGLSKIKANGIDVDVMIIDIRMTGMSGIEMVGRLTTESVNKRYLILSMHDSEEYVMQSVHAGAHGYLLKDASKEEFIKAIKTIHRGDVYFSGDISKYLFKNVSNQPASIQTKEDINSTALSELGVTRRELEILNHIAKGLSNLEIAESLGKSKRTIESHRFNLMKKMEVKNQIELTNKARVLGIIS